MIPRENKPMRDHEVMDMVLNRGDAQELARLLSVSPQLIRAWCRPPETEEEYATGKFGPLARLRTIIHLVKEDDGETERAYPIGQYVAALLGGTFVPNPKTTKSIDADAVSSIAAILKETGDVVQTFSNAWFGESPRKITAPESVAIDKQIREAIIALVTMQRFIGR